MNNVAAARGKGGEWSVMTLYDDVRHYEEQRQLKESQTQDKLHNRYDLNAQVCDRDRDRNRDHE